MKKLRIAVLAAFSFASLGLLVWAFTPELGADSFKGMPTSGDDPDLPPGRSDVDKERYLERRNEWTMLRRGFDADRPFDPKARDRAIENMGRQLRELEAARINRGINGPAASTTAWTPVGPAPIPMGQTEDRVDPVTGRIISLAIHPANPDIVFVGTASGGLYRTLNGQAASPTWTPLFDTVQLQANGIAALGTLAIGVIAIAPSDPDIVYIGTGEQFTGYFGTGLYRLDNATQANPTLVGPINPTADYGGVVTSTFTFRAISQILVHPTAPGTIFVSTSSGNGGITTHNGSNPPVAFPPLGILGLYRSTNANAAADAVTFAKLTVTGIPTAGTDISDMVLDPSDATANTLILWSRGGGGVADGCTTSCAGVYRSTNAAGAGTFTQQLISNNGFTRGELAINNVGGVVTVLAATGEAVAAPNPNGCEATHLGRLRRSVDGGVTWPETDVTTAAQGGVIRAGDGFCGGQCFYDIGVAMDPTNASLIQIGGSGNYGGCQTLTKRSTDGVTLTPNITGLHADVHAFAVSRSNTAIVWTGNDGGLWRSTDSGATWTSMNGDPALTTNPTNKISATQYVSIATHPIDREYMTGGTQDNGTHFKRSQANAGAWTQIAFGDGGYTAIDQNATNTTDVRIYHTYFNLAGTQILYEFVTNTADAEAKNWTSRPCVAGGAGNTRIDCNDTAVSFYAPMVLGPGTPNTLYFGTDRLYRSADGGDTMQLASQGPIVAGGGVEVTSISVGLGNDNVRLVGMRDGTVWATTDGSNNLVNVTPVGAPAGTTVGKVLIDPNNTNPAAITAYIAYGGFGTAAAPMTHFWKTTNLAGGAGNWVAMSNGLPDIPINAIAIDRQSAVAPLAGTSLYLGTDIGVYQSTDGGTTWAIFNPNNTLPVLPVFDISFQEQTGVAGSGRVLRIATHGRGIWEIQTIAGNPTPTPTPGGPTPTPGGPTPTPNPVAQARNLSTRLLVGTVDNVGIGGFIVQGTGPIRVIIRAIGPSLGPLGIPNPLADPVLQLQGAGGINVTNDDWRSTQQQEIIDTGIPPTDDLESAIVANLNPGAYTAIVSGLGATTGTALVEIYDLSQGATAKLGNISTRAFVNTGNDIVIAGFILGGGTGNDPIIARGIGPSLGALGLDPVLADPTLELRNSNGAVVATNNNWQDNPAQAAIVTAAGLAPTNAMESAIAVTLPPAAYTALLAGANNGTGLGLVEVYDNPASGATPTPGAATPTPAPTPTPGPGNPAIFIANGGDATVANSSVTKANLDGTGGISLGNLGGLLNTPQGIAINATTGKMYLANEVGNTVTMSNLDGSGAMNLTFGGLLNGPYGVALDLAAGRLYVANGNGTIVVADLAGAGPMGLGTFNNLLTGAIPQGMAVDPAGGKMYVALQQGSKVIQANLDGSGAVALAGLGGLIGAQIPLDVAVNVPGNRMYVVTFDGSLFTADLSGNNAVNLGNLGGTLNSPRGIGLDLVAQKMYVGNSGNNTLTQADLPDGANPVALTVTTLNTPAVVAVFRP